MSFQDDKREIQVRELFKLSEPENRSRHDTDAILDLGKDGIIEFELKSTQDGKSITTARDVGYTHLEKWKTKHWLVGIYEGKKFKHAYYMPPRILLPWIEIKENYIKPDYEISNLLHKKISLEEMYGLIGKKAKYTYEDAHSIQKMQMKKEDYLELMDLEDGYSPKKMLSLIHDRAKYLILRGYTLNNPHIPNKIMLNGYKIENDFSKNLIKCVRKEI